MAPHRSFRAGPLAPWLAWGLLLVAMPALAEPSEPSEPSNNAIKRTFRLVLGPQLQFLRPQVEGFPTMFALGPEFALLWQLEPVQLRLQAHLLGAGGGLSLKEGEDSSAFSTVGVAADVGARVALGGFEENSAGYLFVYPALFSLNASVDSPEGKRRVSLNEFALQLGAGHVFHIAHTPTIDASATLFLVHTNPRSSRTEVAFTPGLSVAFAL